MPVARPTLSAAEVAQLEVALVGQRLDGRRVERTCRAAEYVGWPIVLPAPVGTRTSCRLDGVERVRKLERIGSKAQSRHPASRRNGRGRAPGRQRSWSHTAPRRHRAFLGAFDPFVRWHGVGVVSGSRLVLLGPHVDDGAGVLASATIGKPRARGCVSGAQPHSSFHTGTSMRAPALAQLSDNGATVLVSDPTGGAIPRQALRRCVITLPGAVPAGAVHSTLIRD